MEEISLKLKTLEPPAFALCRFSPGTGWPGWTAESRYLFLARTEDEISVMCEETLVPPDIKCELGWRGFRVEGKLPFELTGILAALSGTLSRAGIALFAISTFDTDYLWVKRENWEVAVRALEEAGHRFV